MIVKVKTERLKNILPIIEKLYIEQVGFWKNEMYHSDCHPLSSKQRHYEIANEWSDRLEDIKMIVSDFNEIYLTINEYKEFKKMGL